MKIAIAGASGFVGKNLINALAQRQHEIIALSRSPVKPSSSALTYRTTDLFSAQSTLEGLRGAEVAVYLVHSMMPSTRLFQGDFHDTDILLADNFARACNANGIKKIVYLGGLVPEGFVSRHLMSRHEVGDLLRDTSIPVTELRAGMIVGPGGSSFEILRSLVERLPVMILPEWTKRNTQAVHIEDIVRILVAAIEDPQLQGRTIDAVNGESLTYETLLRQMSEALGLRRWMLHVPIQSTEFSKRWVTWFGSSTYELVSPLIDSLLCDLPASSPDPMIQPLIRFPTFRSMVSLKPDSLAVSANVPKPRRRQVATNTVRSIQRLPSIPNRDCHWIATEYMNWLPAFFHAWIRVQTDPKTGIIRFHLGRLRASLLELQYAGNQADSSRKKFHIIGGLLSRSSDTGWLEFRQIQNRRYTLAAIHEFVPALPWFIYLLTQAPLHRWVMGRFGQHLKTSM